MAASTTTTSSSGSTIPDTFRAYVFEKFGDALTEIKLRTDFPQPPLGPTQVRIRVHSAALNPIDYKLVEFGKLFLLESPSAEKPCRLGFDVAGTLVEIGDQVSREDLKIGAAVYAMAFFGGTGSFAEYFDLDAKYVAPKPTNLSFNNAVGLPLVGLTSYQALVTFGKLKKGDRVLILGGSSGTGGLAIQIAKARGAAHVVTTASSRNVELVKSFGADQVIDYTTANWADVIEEHSIDLIYDCAMEPHSWNDAAQRVLKKDSGIFVTIQPHMSPKASSIGATFHSILTDSNAVDLMELTALVEAGKISIPIDSVHLFESFLDAVKVQMSGHARGKIILQVVPESAEHP